MLLVCVLFVVLMFVFFLFFFFSSRRRHTRLVSDWSSDVCSSDLYGGSTGFGRDYRERLYDNWGIVDVDDCVNGAKFLSARSEERRVGKECRSRGSPYQ